MKSVFNFDSNMSPFPAQGVNLVWRNVKCGSFAIYGSDCLDEKGFCRLSEAERNLLRPVNEGAAWLSEQSSGLQVRFVTDSAQVFVRVKNRSKFDMTNMTQIGQCGMDLYVYDESLNAFALHEVARFQFDSDTYELSMSRFTKSVRKPRKFVFYLPLYMAMEEMEIGLDKDAALCPLPFEDTRRIIVYGTSIIQGCSASRPGMAPTNIVSRELKREVVNLGFSGCAFMEREMGEIIGKRKLDLLIVDTEPNAGVDERMEQNSEKFFDEFFAYHPDVPVILYSRILFAMDLYDDYRIRLADYYRDYLIRLTEKYRAQGRNIHFVDGAKIFGGNFAEYTADGIHPSDMGMRLIADSYLAEIKKIEG